MNISFSFCFMRQWLFAIGGWETGALAFLSAQYTNGMEYWATRLLFTILQL